MASRAKERLTPMLQWFRDFIYQRKYNNALRYAADQVPRDVQPVELPGGVSHKLSANVYATRDGRRFSKPAEVVFANATSSDPNKRLTAAAPNPASLPQQSLPPAPGFLFSWDTKPTPIVNYWGKHRNFKE